MYLPKCIFPEKSEITTAKLLGIQVDHNLTWSSHMAALTKKLARINCLLQKLREFFLSEDLKQPTMHIFTVVSYME